jgi:farnesol dehydrogenase
MRIFLTGATGYLGAPLARRLAEAGHEVRALVRATSDRTPLAAAGVATFTGDVCDRFSMREAMSGSDWVIHAAAEVDPDAPPDRMRAVNVEGSENVASLAHKLGVGRLLSVSSVAAFGGSPDDGTAADEEALPRQPFPSAYSATKNAGQQAIRAYARRGLRLNTVFPGLVYGPPGLGGANRLMRRVLRGRYAVMTGGERRMSWIYLDDVVAAILAVVAKAPPGRDFLLAGEVATVRSVVERLCALGGVAPPRLHAPVAAARLLMRGLAPLYALRGRRPPFSPAQLGSLTRHWAFDDARARRELDWRPRGLDSGLAPTIEHLRAPLPAAASCPGPPHAARL